MTEKSNRYHQSKAIPKQNQMKEETERLLQLIKAGKVTEAEIRTITDRIRQSIKEDASLGREYGELLSRINQAMKTKTQPAAVSWVQVGNGFLAIGHKPGGKTSFEGLKEEGTSTVLTLLHENEGASLIGKRVQAVQIGWIWFPFSASQPHGSETIAEVHALYTGLSDLLHTGNKIYIHCSAGIHRTGMITYGLLRFLGKEKSEAFELLQNLRAVTAAQVGEERLLWADQFGREL
jgi:hypothetical protein